MKNLEGLLSAIMDNDITLLAARPASGKMTITNELLYKYTIKKNKKTLLFSTDGGGTYFVNHLVSRISEIPHDTVYKYYYPCNSLKKESGNIDRNKYIDAIELLQKKELHISDTFFIVDDYIDYLLEYNDLESFDIIIINSLEELSKHSKYSIDELFIKLKESCKKHNTHLLIWNGLNRDVEKYSNRKLKLKDINNYDKISKYIDNIILLKRLYDIISVRNYLTKNGVVNFDLKYNYDLDLVVEEE